MTTTMMMDGDGHGGGDDDDDDDERDDADVAGDGDDDDVVDVDGVADSTGHNGSNSKYAIIFGNEVNGIEQRTIDLSDMAIEIPQYGTKHSLNISVAAGIIIWNIFSKINH